MGKHAICEHVLSTVQAYDDLPDEYQNCQIVDFHAFVDALNLFRTKKNGQSQTLLEENRMKFIFRAYDIDEDGFISEDELFQVLNEIVSKELPNLTEAQLREVISYDFAIYKEQYKAFEDANPLPPGRRRRPKKPDRLDFEEFKFILQAKYEHLQTVKGVGAGNGDGNGGYINIPLNRKTNH